MKRNSCTNLRCKTMQIGWEHKSKYLNLIKQLGRYQIAHGPQLSHIVNEYEVTLYIHLHVKNSHLIYVLSGPKVFGHWILKVPINLHVKNPQLKIANHLKRFNQILKVPIHLLASLKVFQSFHQGSYRQERNLTKSHPSDKLTSKSILEGY